MTERVSDGDRLVPIHVNASAAEGGGSTVLLHDRVVPASKGRREIQGLDTIVEGKPEGQGVEGFRVASHRLPLFVCVRVWS